MRIAFVDLLFSWPPNGGADVDLYQVATGLARAGQDVRLFVVHEEGAWECGAFEPEGFPIAATRLDFPPGGLRAAEVCARLKTVVDAWKPDVVFLCDGYFLKPHVALALAHHPLVLRYYAHEMACHRDILRFKDGAVCPNAYLKTPEDCRQCALEFHKPALRHMELNAWRAEYLAAQAYAPEYYVIARDALRRARAGIVYNRGMQSLLEPQCARTLVVPGGVDPEAYRFTIPEARRVEDLKTVFMPGRAEDPAKGLAVLLAACEKLHEERADFELVVTMPQDLCEVDYVRAVGWAGREEMAALYELADVCVVPSVWDEPFGLVAVEAMASGRPVCASRVGGLQEIVVHMETGFLFDRGDSGELAKQLSILLDNHGLRQQMGVAARARVERAYTWDVIVSQHYLPLIDSLTRGH